MPCQALGLGPAPSQRHQQQKQQQQQQQQQQQHWQPRRSQWHLRQQPARRQRLSVAAAAGGRSAQQPDPYAVLQVPRGAGRRAIRAAYIQRIKLLHPDVSSDGEESTAEAAAVNAAYEALMAGFDSNSRDGSDEEGEAWDPLSVFDEPEAEPNCLFVDPFACYNVSPLQWEQLQAMGAAAAAAGRDPWLALREQGVQCGEGAFVWLSPRQLELVSAELERACASLDPTATEAAAFFLSDCLMRARTANARMPSRRRY